MPRLRLSEQTGKRRKASGQDFYSNTGTTSNSTDFGASSFDDSLDELPDFSYDEFDFSDSNKKPAAVAQPTEQSTVNPYKKKNSPSPTVRSPTISSRQITVHDLKKSKSTKTKNGYNKLFNSSKNTSEKSMETLNDENNDPDSNVRENGSEIPVGKKKQKVSFSNDSDDGSQVDQNTDKIQGAKKSQGKAAVKNKGRAKKTTKNPEPDILLEELQDSDDDSVSKEKSAGKGKGTKTAKKSQTATAKKGKTKQAMNNKQPTILTEELQDSDNDEIQENPTKKSTKKPVKKPRKSTASKNNLADKMVISKPIGKSVPQSPTASTQILPFRSVAIDNRALPSVSGDSSTRYFLGRLAEFMEEALGRGLLTSETVVTSLQCEEQSVKARGLYLLDGMEASGGRYVRLWCSEYLSPVNCGFVGGVSDVDEAIQEGDRFGFDYGEESMNISAEGKERKIEGFTAADSWSYFGDLVLATCRKIPSAPIKNPYALSIFTTDAALFAETNPDSHVAAFHQFWKRISRTARAKLTSISIVIVDVTSAARALKIGRTHGPADNEFSDSLQILQCINILRRRIQDVSDAAVKISLEFMDGSTVDFQTLLQMWTREGLAQTYQSMSGVGSIDGKLQFELPETIDGTMCSISLDLQYTMLPGRIDSPSTMELVKDMQMLSSLSPSSVEVLQTIPLHSVDSSLIYGVPMYARPGLEHDLFQYNQMKILVRQLWKYLSRNDVALVLRVGQQEEEQDGNIDSNTWCHRSQDQLFLLTSQVAVQKQSIHPNPETTMQSSAFDVKPDHQRKGESPCNGMLYKYASKNQILHFGNEESDSKEEDAENSAEVNEYADYIERSMDMLTSTGLNPFLVGNGLGCESAGFTQSQERD